MRNNSIKHIDYKDIETLKKYLNPHGRIVSKRYSKVSSKTQRKIAQAIKHARYMGLLPYISR